MPAVSTITPVANQNLNALPGESIQQYEARLGKMSAGVGTGFGTPAPIALPLDKSGVKDTGSSEDAVAKSLGYNSYQEAVASLTAPSDDTTKFYNDAYAAAGLDALSTKIAQRKSDLNQATGNINDNPWLDESTRVGRTRNLTDLANADIKNYQSEYDTKLKSVHDLVTQHSKDLSTTAASNKAKLAALEAQAKALATEATNSTKAPSTISGPNGTKFQWNASTQSFEPINLSGTGGGASTPQFKFSAKQLTALASQGLDANSANGILQDINAGHDLESIRQQMRANKLDPGLLDSIMYFVDPAHNTPKKTSSSSTGRTL